MLMLTHTWILNEFLGSNVNEDNLDVFAYNVSPDILCIHEIITSEMTHGVTRRLSVPPQYSKASYVYFHLLIDDIAHHGKIRDAPITHFNPDSDGYTYVKGRQLIQPIRNLYESLGKNISYSEAAYQAHMIIEMAFDLALYREQEDENLISLFCNAISYAENQKMTEFSNTLSWLYGIDKNIVIEAMKRGVRSCRPERMKKLMNIEDRVNLYVKKFGLGEDNRAALGVRNIMARGMELVCDYRNFLHPAIKSVRETGLLGCL